MPFITECSWICWSGEKNEQLVQTVKKELLLLMQYEDYCSWYCNIFGTYFWLVLLTTLNLFA